MVLIAGTHCLKSVRIRSYSGSYFPAFGLNTERFRRSLRIESECGKMRTRITPNMDTFHSVTFFIVGHILAAFYYGYLITQIPGGYIAARFGGKNLFGIAILLSAMLTLITPLASREHWSFLFILRFIEGLCEVCFKD